MTAKIPTLRDFPTRVLDMSESMFLIGLLMNSNLELRAEITDTSFDEVGFLGKVFARRLHAHGVRLELRAALYVLSLLTSPGDSTMWVWTLFNLQRNADHVVTLDELIGVFPLGVPSPEAYSGLWDAQKNTKSSLGNALDAPETWVRL